ncbi:large ribosomal subunit protein mL46-like isoform X2 [Ruditapes philippinarum]|uniref:large ribosomal subunit protein mL46-like isoform X2 n=1 Tax=Ruditapes philippinarum TaxID=129788 RepID=UPI00295C10AB|nr:large ribosomal subunit protein mL46-like isoform X2 [Ruditapes philippinarum]
MLSKTCGCCQLQRYSQAVGVAKAKTWQLHSAVCLQRYPVITTPLNEFEQKYKDYLTEIEINNSLLSDHELQNLAEKKKKMEPTEEKEVVKKKVVEEKLLTAEEMEDEWQKELDKFEFADRITDADRNNDMTSPNRKLDKRLVLITKQHWGDDTKAEWAFPQILRQDGESMREAAERALSTHCGGSINAKFIGNAPCGYTRYKLPKSEDEYGVKLFFFKANYQGGDVELCSNNNTEYKWVTIDELKDYFLPDYREDIEEFLIDL